MQTQYTRTWRDPGTAVLKGKSPVAGAHMKADKRPCIKNITLHCGKREDRKKEREKILTLKQAEKMKYEVNEIEARKSKSQ